MVALCTSFYIITISNVIRWWGPRRRHLHRTTFSMKHLFPLSSFSHQRCFATLVDRLIAFFHLVCGMIGFEWQWPLASLLFIISHWCSSKNVRDWVGVLCVMTLIQLIWYLRMLCVTTRYQTLNEKRKSVCITGLYYTTLPYMCWCFQHMFEVFFSLLLSHSFQRKFSLLSMDDATFDLIFLTVFFVLQLVFNTILFLFKLLSRCL